MTRFRRLTAPSLVLALLLAAAAMAPTAEASTTRSYAAKVNQVRASHGLQKLTVSRSLQRSSSTYSRWMLRRDYFGHRSAIQASRRFSRRGEVLARTGARAPTAAEIVRAWLKSPTHRAVLLNPRYRFIGIGQARGSLGADAATLVTGHFGAR